MFLVDGRWHWPSHLPKAIYHWLAAHVLPGTLQEFLLRRPRICIVEDTTTQDAKWKFIKYNRR